MACSVVWSAPRSLLIQSGPPRPLDRSVEVPYTKWLGGHSTLQLRRKLGAQQLAHALAETSA